MFKKLFLLSFLITAGLLTTLYFVDDGVIREAQMTAEHYKGEFRQNVEKAKGSGEELVNGVSIRAKQEKKRLDRYVTTKKLKAREVVHSDKSFLGKAVLTMKEVVMRIENNAKNVLNLL